MKLEDRKRNGRWNMRDAKETKVEDDDDGGSKM
jgi:hypothetical protein